MDKKRDTTEKMAGDAVLQASSKIEIGGRTYDVAKPTVATVIRISELTSELTNAKIDEKGAILPYILENAKDCKAIGEILATLICGYHRKKVVKTYFHGLIRRHINPIRELSEKIIEECSPSELNMAIAKLLGRQQIAFFFSTIISLKEKNILKKTKKNEENQES